MKVFNNIPIVILTLLISSCGTIGHGTHQEIEVRSIPEGATFTVSPTGETGITPTEIELKRSLDYEFVFKHEDFEPRKVYVRRTRSQGAGYANAFVPYVGIIGLGIDSATGAQFNLVPSPVIVDFTEPMLELMDSEFTEVTFFNGNKSGTVNIVFDNGDECKLKKNQYAVRLLNKGTHDFEFYHWDLFKFSDEYKLELNDNNVFLAIFSSLVGTHFAYDNEIPNEFEETCLSEKTPNKNHN